jgi:methionyl-tRNA formyltransferase
MRKYVIAASKDWFRKHKKSSRFDALTIYDISEREELTIEVLDEVAPRFVFFPHWNWIVPPEIFNRYECVVFHTAPLPYGRGGSPVQNLIVRGFNRTPVCALRMSELLDGGPIYQSVEISLAGTIDEIFERIASAVEAMIVAIAEDEPVPVEQVGEPTYFKRRTPAESEIPASSNLADIYNRVRMLDGQGYPPAYIEYGEYRIEFSEASLGNEELTAKVRIKPK